MTPDFWPFFNLWNCLLAEGILGLTFASRLSNSLQKRGLVWTKKHSAKHIYAQQLCLFMKLQTKAIV